MTSPRTLLGTAFFSALLAAAGCESAPLDKETRSSGAAVVVELLDAHFVRVDGVRQPWEELVYSMRKACREAPDDKSRPWVRFVVAGEADADAVPPGTFQRLSTALQGAGVRRIEVR